MLKITHFILWQGQSFNFLKKIGFCLVISGLSQFHSSLQLKINKYSGVFKGRFGPFLGHFGVILADREQTGSSCKPISHFLGYSKPLE